MAPQITQAPTLEARIMLRIKGYFPGQQVQINFELPFEPVAGHWRLFGLGVAAVPANSTPQPNDVPPIPKDAPKKPSPGKAK